MTLNKDGHVSYAPLWIESFRLIAPRKLLEAQRLNQQYQDYCEIQGIPDRLRWCRHRMGLMQKEAAALVGISRKVYLDIETGAVEDIDKVVVDKLAALYQISAEDLTSDYIRFISQGQGEKVKAYRQSLGMGIKAFARYLGVREGTVRDWEAEKQRISRQSWEKHFKGRR